MQTIHQSLGQKSKVAGLILAGLSVVFLGLALYFADNIVFEVDSVVSLLASIAVLLRGNSKSSMQIRIVNRMLDSSASTLSEISSLFFGAKTAFSYILIGNKIGDVVAIATPQLGMSQAIAALKASTDGTASIAPEFISRPPLVTQKNVVPPGRALAELYQRELNMVLSETLLVQSLPSIVCERFELASSLSINIHPGIDSIEIRLRHPAVRQSCTLVDGISPSGMLGCPLSSMLAVLFSYALSRPVCITQCVFDRESDSLEISLKVFGGGLEEQQQKLDAR